MAKSTENRLKRNLFMITAVLMLGIAVTVVITASPAFAAKASEKGRISEQYAPMQIQETDPAEAEELLVGYMQEQVSKEAGSIAGAETERTRGSRLTGNEAVAYHQLRTVIEEIAAGRHDEAIVTIGVGEFTEGRTAFTADELGVSSIYEDGELSAAAKEAAIRKVNFELDPVIDALLADLPYDLYWYDKTRGANRTLKYSLAGTTLNGEEAIRLVEAGTSQTVKMYVSRDYSKSGETGTLYADTGKTGQATAAADRAGQIISKYAQDSDLNKLKGYRQEICTMTDYDHDAADNGRDYGDPWQMIHVFDDDPSTMVVCEGYSKAFQFLCDMTQFKRKKIRSHLMTGTMETNLSSAGPHMWNVVHMDDRQNYLVDVTNCDNGSIGATERLFLKGAVYTDAAGCRYNCGSNWASYTYDKNTVKQYSEEERIVSGTDYTEMDSNICLHEPELVAETAPTCTKAGNRAYYLCYDCETAFSDQNGRNPIAKDSRSIPALGHAYAAVAGSAEAAACVKPGKKEDMRCARCGDVKAGAVIPATGRHTLKEVPATKPTYSSAGNTAYYICGVCGMCFRDAAGTEKIARDSWVLRRITPKAGDQATVKGMKYKVVSGSGATVTFTKAKKTVKTVTVPKTVKIQGKTFRVIRIDADAFKGTKAAAVTVGANVSKLRKYAFRGSKVKTLTLKTKKLKKAGVKGSLKSSKVRTVKVRLGSSKTNRTYVVKYGKIFTKKIAGRSVTVK